MNNDRLKGTTGPSLSPVREGGPGSYYTSPSRRRPARLGRQIRSSRHVLQVAQQRRHGAAGVVEVEVAVLVRGVEGAEKLRAEPLLEVVRPRLGILQRLHELQGPLHRV